MRRTISFGRMKDEGTLYGFTVLGTYLERTVVMSHFCCSVNGGEERHPAANPLVQNNRERQWSAIIMPPLCVFIICENKSAELAGRESKVPGTLSSSSVAGSGMLLTSSVTGVATTIVLCNRPCSLHSSFQTLRSDRQSRR